MWRFFNFFRSRSSFFIFPGFIVFSSKINNFYFRARITGTRGEQHRLSVPNLAELMHNAASTDSCNGAASSAKALTSKLGRTPGTGELQVQLRTSFL